MRPLTEDATVRCDHGGTVTVLRRQELAFVGDRALLVGDDLVKRTITLCPLPAPMKLCTLTVNRIAGHSRFVRVAGRPLCLDSHDGLTDGSPPGAVHYRVNAPGQALISCSA